MNRLTKAEWDAYFIDPVLPETHIKRFEQRLDHRMSRRRQSVKRIVWISTAIAASFIGLICGWERESQQQDTPTMFPAEIAEVCNYYNSQLYFEKEKIKTFFSRIDATDREAILQSFQQMKQDQESIMADLNSPISNDQRIAYLVQCYTSQLESLRDVYSQLETINKN